jgi:hypothetical protein
LTFPVAVTVSPTFTGLMNFASTKRTPPPCLLTTPHARVTTEASVDIVIIPCPTVSGMPNTLAREAHSSLVWTGFMSSEASA